MRLSLLLIVAIPTIGLAADAPQFERDIAPLLKRACVKCHGPVKHEGELTLSTPGGVIRGGKSGPGVIPHDVAGSVIWQKVEADEMPPEMPLTDEEKKLLKQWIQDGTPGLKNTGDRETEHWAFVPLDTDQGMRPIAIPIAVGAANPLDAFLLDNLQRDGLVFLPEADRYSLIRRVSLDLTGLPPSRAEIARFVTDQKPDAYSSMVDRYLDSPHYGERMGKFWLDASGYADSNGYFNADSDRPLAYRFRDYVIRALNADKPFNEFIKEQIAGDEMSPITAKMGDSIVLPEPAGDPNHVAERTIELWEATHFLRNGQDGSGESDGNPDEVRIDRYTVIETTMQNMSTALLGMTIQCAKCHDHKFEPLTQRDYYSFQAVLIPVFPPESWKKPNERFVYASLPGEMEVWQGKLNELDATIAAKRTEVDAWVKANRPRGAVLFAETFDGPAESLLNEWSNTAPGDDAPGGTAAVNVNSKEAPGAIIAEGKLNLIEGGPSGDKWISTKRAFDWSPDEKGASIQVTFDLVSNKVNDSPPAERLGYFIALHDFNNNSPVAGGNILVDGHPSQGTSVILDYPTSPKSLGTLGKTGYVPGRNYGIRITNVGDGKFQLQQLVDWQVDEPTIKLSEADLPSGGFGFEFCCNRSFIVDNVVVETFTATEGGNPLESFLKQLTELRQTLDEANKTKTSLANSRPGKLSWTTDVVDQPPEVHVFERGNYATPGELVQPSGYTILGDATQNANLAKESIQKPTESKTSGRRLAFANWLTQPGSKPASLMARVQMNRLWQQLFGTGLVATADNLGVSGAVPVNRELLNWLAAEYIRSGWSTKHVVRLIVSSNAYRQSSLAPSSASASRTTTADHQPDRFQLDADGRRLSRFPVRRLDAEAIRDMLLSASDDFDDRMYGSYVPTSRTSNGETVVPENNPGVRRRSIYLQQKRTQVHSLLQVFDAPSIVFNNTRRARSTMPLQSLSLMNSEFVVARAKHLAQELEGQFADEADRVNAAFEITVGRPATSDDMQTVKQFLQNQQEEYRELPDASRRAWADLCQMLLVENAALYLD